MLYDPEGVRKFYNDYGTTEWERLDRSLPGRIKYAIHRHFLDRYIPPGSRVLDAGCGPGRFALHLARMGARLTLADLSPVQLALAREKLTEAHLMDQVEAFHCLDMVHMPALPDARFDAVVAYGAALSYTCEHHEAALHELVRVLRPGGFLLISVCSLYGALRLVGPLDADHFLSAPTTHLEWEAVLAGQDTVYTRPGSDEFHQPMVLLTSAGLRRILTQAGLRVVELAAADPVVAEVAKIPRITDNPQAVAGLTALEIALCTQPGLIDSGEHLLAVAQKPAVHKPVAEGES